MAILFEAFLSRESSSFLMEVNKNIFPDLVENYNSYWVLKYYMTNAEKVL